MVSAVVIVSLVLWFLMALEGIGLHLELRAHDQRLRTLVDAVNATNRRLATVEKAQRLTGRTRTAGPAPESMFPPADAAPVRAEVSPAPVSHGPRSVRVELGAPAAEEVRPPAPAPVSPDPTVRADVDARAADAAAPDPGFIELAAPRVPKGRRPLGGFDGLTNVRRDPDTRPTVEMPPPAPASSTAPPANGSVEGDSWDDPEERTKLFTKDAAPTVLVALRQGAVAPSRAARHAERPPPIVDEDDAMGRASILPGAPR